MTADATVVLACDTCGHEWTAAQVRAGAWWSAPPEVIAARCYCPRCAHAPPMRIVKEGQK
jgi:hypothetical protein